MFNLFKKAPTDTTSAWAIEALDKPQDQVEEKKTMVVTFSGSEICDLLYYVSTIGVKEGKKVLVIDNSWNHDFFSLYGDGVTDKDGDGNPDIEHINNLTVCRGYKLTDEQMEYFDNVFIYTGHNIECESLYTPDYIVYNITSEANEVRNIITSYTALLNRLNAAEKRAAEGYSDEEYRENDEYSEAGKPAKIKRTEPILIFRDLINKRVNTMVLMRNNNINIEKVVEIPLQADDKCSYINLTYNGETKLKGLSREMSDAVRGISRLIYDINEKKMMKYFK